MCVVKRLVTLKRAEYSLLVAKVGHPEGTVDLWSIFSATLSATLPATS